MSTVVVTLHGELDEDGAEILGALLRDLIDYQGNQDVVVDLRDLSGFDQATVIPFRDAFRWARRHGATFRLHGPPAALSEALIRAPSNQELDAFA